MADSKRYAIARTIKRDLVSTFCFQKRRSETAKSLIRKTRRHQSFDSQCTHLSVARFCETRSLRSWRDYNAGMLFWRRSRHAWAAKPRGIFNWSAPHSNALIPPATQAMHVGIAAILPAAVHVLQTLNLPQLGFIQRSLCEDNCAMQQLQAQLPWPFLDQVEWWTERFEICGLEFQKHSHWLCELWRACS